MEVTNRFKGLDLIDRVPEELWTEVHDIVQEAVIKTIPKKKKCKKAKWLSEEGNPAGLSSCSGGLRPLVELCVEPAGATASQGKSPVPP